ncbi:hypothetical protein FH609_029350 [Streptomyces sp. 3MP-14]|uniref:Sensor domain-containing protein n=1 Tax=Streptomyces mimosae TaxID=2586635 RepID=A0A5N5ZSI8_9ACTN|nr:MULTISPECIES: hypothetical protein [Streptomyces]KAB8159474.1 hypothetical protein FH607_028465 [Streptomyces mimosae]KAB8172638.1 hypothetical protein FH609_029350 [Streptomyces sp. 3MP-14]
MRHTRGTTRGTVRGLAIAAGAALGAGALAVTTLSGTATADQPATANGAGASATGTSGVTEAAAIPADAFLTGDELPEHPDGWYSEGPVDGLPEVPVFCYDPLLPEENVAHVTHWTELDTTAVQVVMDLGSEGAAAGLVEVLDEASTNCASEWLWQHPGATASWDDFGGVAGADYARVVGVHTAPPESAHDVNLFAVIREGSLVTVVRWGQMGTLSQAPVAEFLATAEAALARLEG